MMPFYVDLRGNEVGEIFVLHPRNEEDVLPPYRRRTQLLSDAIRRVLGYIRRVYLVGRRIGEVDIF
jgi:hypothetical protein